MDFLDALSGHDHIFTSNHLIDLEKNPSHQFDFPNLIEQYRNYSKSENLRQASRSGKYAAFPATFRGTTQDLPPPPCVCGSRHYWVKCYYLNTDNRPTGWTPNKETQAKVQKAISNTDLKAKIEASIKRSKQRSLGQPKPEQSSSTKEDQPSQQPRSLGNYPARITTFYTKPSKPETIELSWMLDSGASNHICNKHMKERFTKTYEANENQRLTCGTQSVPVECYGTVTINVQTPEGQATMTLVDVAYVPNLQVNLVSLDKLWAKEVH